jgi:transposase
MLGRTSENYKPSARKAHSYKNSSAHHFVPTNWYINPLNPELNPICYLLALLGAHHFLHVSRIMVKSLTLRLLMSYTHTHTHT